MVGAPQEPGSVLLRSTPGSELLRSQGRCSSGAGARGGFCKERPSPTTHTGPANPLAPASEHGCVTPNLARHTGQSVPAPEHEPSHPNRQRPHCDTDTPAT